MKAYVEASVSEGRRLDLEDFVGECFAKQPRGLKDKLVERVSGILAALNDANRIVYGVPKALFADFQRLPGREGG